jgi:beta-glucosidase
MKNEEKKKTDLIYTLSGTEVTEQECEFLSKAQPYGICIFKRNITSFDQLKAFCDKIKSISPDTLFFIDEEGGRVSRCISAGLISQDEFPSAASYNLVAREKGLDFAKDLLRSNCYQMGLRLKYCGITTVFGPCIDMYHKYGNGVIGDRSFGYNFQSDEEEPDLEGQVIRIVEFAKDAIQGWLDAGIHVVIKHALGHGRSDTDTHIELSRVSTPLEELEQTDIAVFRKLATDLKPIIPNLAVMTAHIIYDALDHERPATTSKKVIDYIRELGFNQIISDALEMKALRGVVKSAIDAEAAGVDVLLYCDSDMEIKETLENTFNHKK